MAVSEHLEANSDVVIVPKRGPRPPARRRPKSTPIRYENEEKVFESRKLVLIHYSSLKKEIVITQGHFLQTITTDIAASCRLTKKMGALLEAWYLAKPSQKMKVDDQDDYLLDQFLARKFKLEFSSMKNMNWFLFSQAFLTDEKWFCQWFWFIRMALGYKSWEIWIFATRIFLQSKPQQEFNHWYRRKEIKIGWAVKKTILRLASSGKP